MKEPLSLWQRIVGGPNKVVEMPYSEVIAIVNGYKSEKTTTYLYETGKQLVAQVDATATAIDVKANAMLAYGAGIIAFLVVRITATTSPWEIGGYLVAGAAATASCVYGFLTLRAAGYPWKGFSERTWFDRQSIEHGPEAVQRTYLVAMHRVVKANHRTAAAKADKLIRAQLFLAVAAAAMALTVASAALAKVACSLSWTSATCETHSDYSPGRIGRTAEQVQWTPLGSPLAAQPRPNRSHRYDRPSSKVLPA